MTIIMRVWWVPNMSDYGFADYHFENEERASEAIDFILKQAKEGNHYVRFTYGNNFLPGLINMDLVQNFTVVKDDQTSLGRIET